MIIINPENRQFSIPGDDLVFGVEFDAGSERKYFQCPRYVGDKLDLSSCFIRVNFRNANGDIDAYLVDDVAVDGDNVTFSWVLSHKAVMYKGQIKFVVCAIGPNQRVEWNTTLGTGMVLEGLEPDSGAVLRDTADVVSQLITMVEVQTEAVKTEGATQIKAVQAAAEAAEAASVAEIEAKGVNTRESIPADYTALSEAVDSLVRSRAGAIVCDVEGSVISISDASDNYVQGLRIFGRSTQDGTPTPETPVEIVSVVEPVVTVCGKNLATRVIDYDATVKGVRITASADSSEFTLDGTAETQFSNVAMRSEVLSPGTYTISVKGLHAHTSSLDRIYVAKEIDNKVLANPVQDNTPKTFELDEPTRLRVDLVLMGDSTYNNATIKVQIEVGEVATEYEPHRVVKTLATTHTLPGIPVTSGGNYTDSNGQQWICDEVDLERGVYVQRTKLFDLSELKTNTWYTWGVNYSTNGITGFYHFFSDDVTNAIVLSNIGQYSIKAWGGVGVGVGIGTSADGDYFIVALPNEALADTSTDAKAIESFLAFIADTEAVILAAVAPVETPLSETELAAWRTLHTNKPNTTILNDSGAHMAVSYAADTKLYIDNKIAALTAKA